jgi:hypothetical protein
MLLGAAALGVILDRRLRERQVAGPLGPWAPVIVTLGASIVAGVLARGVVVLIDPGGFVMRVVTACAAGLVMIVVVAAAHAVFTGVAPRSLVRSYGADPGRFAR